MNSNYYYVHFLIQPCPCGFLLDDNGRCNCTSTEINKYMKKISGPIMDRIDLHVEMRKLTDEELMNYSIGESSNSIKARVMKARELQKRRYGEGVYNGTISQKQIQKYCKLSEENREYFKKVIQVMEISARGYDKILKVARTIADLEGSENIEKEHLMEAVSFRNK